MHQILRYGVNGLAATAVHYGVLWFGIEWLHLPSAGLTNVLASIFGITTSFLGNRYFVFPFTGERLLTQALKFSGVFGLIAVLHGLTLLVWTDLLAWDYRTGFVLAVALQFVLGYAGSRRYVFNNRNTAGNTPNGSI